MADNKPLSPTQKTILRLLREHGSAAIAGQRGRTGFDRSLRHRRTEFGLVIEAYQGPDYFLLHRGLIERLPSNAPGVWYRLTEHGEKRAATLAVNRS